MSGPLFKFERICIPKIKRPFPPLDIRELFGMNRENHEEILRAVLQILANSTHRFRWVRGWFHDHALILEVNSNPDKFCDRRYRLIIRDGMILCTHRRLDQYGSFTKEIVDCFELANPNSLVSLEKIIFSHLSNNWCAAETST